MLYQQNCGVNSKFIGHRCTAHMMDKLWKNIEVQAAYCVNMMLLRRISDFEYAYTQQVHYQLSVDINPTCWLICDVNIKLFHRVPINFCFIIFVRHDTGIERRHKKTTSTDKICSGNKQNKLTKERGLKEAIVTKS